jgi:SNF2 family DNA or RNA helicase
MGVGKTPETLNIVEKGGFHIPLIVCPNSLRFEWKRQIDEWIEPDICAVCSGDSWMKSRALVESFKQNRKYRIINYEALRNPLIAEMLSHIPFDIIVFDEIHKLRNPKTKLVEGRAKKSNHLERFWEQPKDKEGGTWKFLNQHPNAIILGLSGSPIMNYPNDLYVPLSCVKPEHYPRSIQPWREFMYRYCLWSDSRYGSYIYGTRHLEQLREETSPFIIRRTKKEVLTYLPEKYYRRPSLEMRPDQRKLYDQMETELKILLDTGEPLWSTNILSLLTRLRQINLDPKILGITSSSAKTEFIMDTIESTEDKLVIFSCFEKYIYLLHLLLPNTPHVMITGQVHPDRRMEEVKKFQEDDSIKLCLGTVQAMGEGITLTAASNCIISDRWWNQPTNQQAEDRLHRIGQTRGVQVILPIVSNSIDAHLDEILEKKHEQSQAYYQETEVRQTILGAL